MIRSTETFSSEGYLNSFAAMCEASKEYQGHGWGLALRRDSHWIVTKSLNPIWESSLSDFGETDFLIVHARSAFRDEGIALENNMPFQDDRRIFIFNGELHGVRVPSEGTTGAHKIFNYIKRFDRGDLNSALNRATGIIRQRADYVKAMNIMMTDGERIYALTHFSEDPDYFTLFQQRSAGRIALCSAPLGNDWEPLPNNTALVA